MIVRSATKNDLNRIIALQLINAQYHADMVSGGRLKKESQVFFERQLKKRINDDQIKILVGLKNDIIIGYIIGCIDQQHPIFELGTQALIDDVFVSSEYQRYGYGSILVEELTKWFHQNKVQKIALNVYESNGKGAAFWKKQGFDVMFKRMIKDA